MGQTSKLLQKLEHQLQLSHWGIFQTRARWRLMRTVTEASHSSLAPSALPVLQSQSRPLLTLTTAHLISPSSHSTSSMSSSAEATFKINYIWLNVGHMLLILAPGAEAGRFLWVQGQPDLYSEFLDSKLYSNVTGPQTLTQLIPWRKGHSGYKTQQVDSTTYQQWKQRPNPSNPSSRKVPKCTNLDFWLLYVRARAHESTCLKAHPEKG